MDRQTDKTQHIYLELEIVIPSWGAMDRQTDKNQHQRRDLSVCLSVHRSPEGMFASLKSDRQTDETAFVLRNVVFCMSAGQMDIGIDRSMIDN